MKKSSLAVLGSFLLLSNVGQFAQANTDLSDAYSCKCGHVSGRELEQKNSYQSEFEVTVPAFASEYSVQTPCNGAEVSSELVVGTEGVQLKVYSSIGKQIGGDEKSWDQVEAEFGSKGRFALKYEESRKFQVVVFCAKN